MLDGRRGTNKGGLTQRLLATYSRTKRIRNPLLRSIRVGGRSNPLSVIDAADSGVFEGYLSGSKRLVKSLAVILVISFTIKNGDHRDQKELILD